MIDAASLDRRLEEMRRALDAAPNEVSASLVIPARQGMDNVAKRLALGVDHTVAAFFGGTGSGKSSLFNALTKLDFADVGARRPTTSRSATLTDNRLAIESSSAEAVRAALDSRSET